MTKAHHPLIIGLTGSIGMGKSTVAAMFAKSGVPVFDADQEVRAMQGPGGELIGQIEQAFPGTTNAGGVDRDALGKLVFSDKAKLATLEAIVHPAVAQKRAHFLSDNAQSKIVLFDIPLLFERGGADLVDVVVVVSAPLDVQKERVLARPDMTQEKFEHILSLQMPDVEKRERADHLIDTGTTLAETEKQVAALIEALNSHG